MSNGQNGHYREIFPGYSDRWFFLFCIKVIGIVALSFGLGFTGYSLVFERQTRSVGGIEFIYVPAGEFERGSRYGQGLEDESPSRLVRLDPFYISRSEVTQREYESIMGTNPSQWKGPNLPVEGVSWQDAMEFALRYGAQYGIQARLPSEAEWEYACRAGSTTTYPWGAEMDGRYCWNRDNSGESTNPVCQKLPNAWGIHDMIGNVWEWCMDWYALDYYRDAPTINPRGPLDGQLKVIRGGSRGTDSLQLYSRYRNCLEPDSKNDHVGFRIVIK